METRWCREAIEGCPERGVEDVCFHSREVPCCFSHEDPSRKFKGHSELERAIPHFTRILSKIKGVGACSVSKSDVDGCFDVKVFTKFGESILVVVRLDIMDSLRNRARVTTAIQDIFKNIQHVGDVARNISELKAIKN